MILTFPSPKEYFGFLEICLETPELGRETEIFQKRLSLVRVPRTGKPVVYLSVPDDGALSKRVQEIAVANGAAAQRQTLDRDQLRKMTDQDLLRAIRLMAGPAPTTGVNHVVVALWGVETTAISSLMDQVWNLGVGGIEVAFLRRAGAESPSHLLKVHGLRRFEAFKAYCEGFAGRPELYRPVRTDRRDSRFYVKWGYRFPVTGIEQLAELDRELVLLRPKTDERSPAAEWITFAAGEVNFFRRAYEFVDLKIALEDVPLLELQENTDPPAVPVELALINKPTTSGMRVGQIDKQIDRQRRVLFDLERLRENLAAGQMNQMYFAYRFEQAGETELNPRLTRFMQQRISTLIHFDYAFCRPRNGRPYHLIIANRPQGNLGFSMQTADAVYYLPVAWRNYGLRLFLPLHTELAPRIDDNDALPMLQRILDNSDEQAIGDDPMTAWTDCAAILWEAARDDAIDETRVTRAASLLTQFRLLNSYERNVAGAVELNTREGLATGLRAARLRVGDELDAISREVLEHVGQRTDRLEKTCTELEDDLQAAERVVAGIEPQIGKIRELVLSLPDEWGKFVGAVVSLHRQFVEPQLEAVAEMRDRVKLGRADLKALAARGKDLSAAAESHLAGLQQELSDCEQTIAGDQRVHADIERLHVRATRVFREITTMYGRLEKRLKRTEEIEKRCKKMESDINGIKAREMTAEEKQQELKPLLAEWLQKSEEIEKRSEAVAAEEQKLRKQSEILAASRAHLKERSDEISAQLESIETYLRTYADSIDQLEQAGKVVTEELEMTKLHKDAIDDWDKQRGNWESYISGEQVEAKRRIDQIARSLADLEGGDRELGPLRRLIAEAQEHLERVETLRWQTNGTKTP